MQRGLGIKLISTQTEIGLMLNTESNTPKTQDKSLIYFERVLIKQE